MKTSFLPILQMTYGICGSIGANVGELGCDITRGNPEQLIFGGAEFSPTDYATMASFQTAFIAAINQAAGVSTKLFPIPVIQATTDQTEAAKFDTLGYGLKVKLLRSKPSYDFDVLAGSALEQKLIAFDSKQIPVFVIDDQSNMWGILDSQGNFEAPLWLVSVEPRGFGDAQKAKTTKISISIVNTKDFLENAAFTITNFKSSDLEGLFDVVAANTIAHTTNVYHIGLTIATNQIGEVVNVHDQSAAALASAALWAASTPAGTLAITSVADDPTNGGWTVTLDSTAYTALATGTKITLGLVAPPALFAADVLQLDNTLGKIILVK